MLGPVIISFRGTANLELLLAAAKMDSAGRFAETAGNGAGLVLEAMERRSSANALTGASARSLIHVLRAAKNTLRTAAAAANFTPLEIVHNKGKAEARQIFT
jgi:BioD-like phosphotransacetylase family protein